MQIRYTGPDAARDLTIPGGGIRCEMGQWVDVDAACEAVGVPAYHAVIAVRGLTGQPDWDIRDDLPEPKAAKPAKPPVKNDPATPDEE